MGKRKAKRKLNLFGISYFGRCCGSSLWGQEGAMQSVVVAMHSLFYLSVLSAGLGALNCTDNGTGEKVMWSMNAVTCSCTEAAEANGCVADADYPAIWSLGMGIVLIYGVLMLFMHWSD
eukprot:SAG11_NODE_191_length_12943_cov_3.853706_8_plen_119_part_00